MLAYCEFHRLPDLISKWEVLGLSTFWNAGNVIYSDLNGSVWLAESLPSHPLSQILFKIRIS